MVMKYYFNYTQDIELSLSNQITNKIIKHSTAQLVSLDQSILQLKTQYQQMGVTDSKTISSHIDDQFKSIRKYNDHFYGEITLIQEKSTGKHYALVQKVVVSVDKSMPEFLAARKKCSPYLVKLHEYYHCSVDYCSDSQKFFFLLQYRDRTLYSQMILRQQSKGRFTSQQLFNIFDSYLQLTSSLRDKKQPSKFGTFVSNHFVLYYSPQQLRTLQSTLKVENESFQFDFRKIKSGQASKQLYLSPEAYQLICNKQKSEAKHISYTQKAIVFMLGMNFIECALLVDISDVYNPNKRCIQFDDLHKVLIELQQMYGGEICQMVAQMVAQSPSQRPDMQYLKQYVKTTLKRRKIVTPKHTKIQKTKLQQLQT